MTTLSSWSPYSEFVSLREAMDRLFNDSVVRAGNGNGNGSGTRQMAPAYDLWETEDGLTFRFALLGVRPEDVEITVNQGTLHVKASINEQDAEQEKGWTWHVRGLPRQGTFNYSFRLPIAVDADRAEAHGEHGILTLFLPKAEAAKPKRITVSGVKELTGANA